MARQASGVCSREDSFLVESAAGLDTALQHVEQGRVDVLAAESTPPVSVMFRVIVSTQIGPSVWEGTPTRLLTPPSRTALKEVARVGIEPTHSRTASAGQPPHLLGAQALGRQDRAQPDHAVTNDGA
ncbi:hypothetical protein OOK58_02675 [Streptomyces sp. NBC_01728]|uniref:hypothetical protein n=1 Tax=unclassified Streptomyces TaxID=2593676 RepID=UPI00224F7448|nr:MULTISPECIES: hypothetical protein [unclassified Streptomyces]MCX4461576.1 hypothetical protein [Streptomyces sp. NBC_01719]MCX4490483.1 hypothetical protein [Streptomyces sp. NBC_01728]MCX4597275.1 hypothetical protein [Streptomyces sp. NBC_01549]